MINENELELLEEFAFGDLEEQDFLFQYPIDLGANQGYLIDLMNAASERKDGENVDLLLEVIAMLDMYEDFDFQAKYRQLIREDWHRMHESLVDSLDKTSLNEDSFVYVLNKTFEYYTDGVEDFMVPIWNKCLWSLFRIKSDKGIGIIEQFVDSDYEDLSDTARKLVSKLEDG